MDDENDQYGGYRSGPNCQRVDLSRVTTRELVYHVAASIAGLRDDFPDRFEQLEQVVQGESNDWKEILEDIGTNLESLQQALDDCYEGVEGEEGVKALLREVEDHITSVEVGQNRLADKFKREMDGASGRIDVLNTQSKVLRAEIQALRRTINDRPQFPQFRRLPAEIRLMIWDLALPRRMVCVRGYRYNDEQIIYAQYRFISKSLPPSVAHVCRESRGVACQSGRLVSIRNIKALPSRSPPSYPTKISWAWFDSSRDSLYLQPNTNRFFGLEAIADLTSRAQHVTLDYGPFRGYDTHIYRYMDHLFSPFYFPQLKAIDIAGDQLTQSERSDPVLETRLFGYGGDYPLSIAKDDQSTKTALVKRMKTNHSSDDVDRIEKFLAGLHRSRFTLDKLHCDDQVWSDHIRQWHDRWSMTQYQWDALGGKDENKELATVNGKKKPGLTVKWLRMMEHRRPIIRRVIMLHLGTKISGLDPALTG
ncbi:hypothetical protein F4781DRAFT_380015 [Annulohypoxylon bovei var. microspora]|nr:hypothetical protein F4781DRAFT_380015 [Annulohypoxylon bovei var. microspora]